MDFEIKGIIPAMVTPMDKEGNLNKAALRKLTNHLIDGGVHGLFPVGSTGEYYGLTLDQKREALEIVIEEANGRLPIYAATGMITTKETIQVTQMAEDAGADAVSVLTPMFIRPSENELYNHYKAVAESVDIPVLLYNNPARTGVNVSADLMEKLSQIDNIAGIKDTSGNMTLTGEFIRRTPDDFTVLAGSDTLILSTLVYGGKGAISSTSNIAPELIVRIYEEYIQGNIEEARKAQFELAPLRLAFSLGTFPVIMKEGLKLMGIDAGDTLSPVESIGEEERAKLKGILDNLGLI
ncbi:4-hydroxy-tetrahydrodipicolinate synthase [Orenia metallireducens]|jgi:4-hydroxy-tetrahydrodipicolinate synthase|uniref:4-hydroxy-tetrahydrodipicolinate synthase n=1 Tax=Orenia metallireducens TaxID=1413210 RepID=A0A285GZK9_9FIRM|nr:4-hydroxy-tetrahydrodipicolinate synthase [Orenia metallireducens]PRX21796.1 4-hydroxy-tetrahydrodipicolinate synthase [Orenia metallireducens]SNY29070.1 4-hydroxy-tetrahydrodipicolinate synthase [Orenia metallireducens]